MDTKAQESLVKSVGSLADMISTLLPELEKIRNRISIMELTFTAVTGIDIDEIHKKMEQKGIKIT